MLMRRSSLPSRLTALLLSVATPVMPVGMALMPLAPAPTAMAPMSADAPMDHETMHHEGMHHHDAPSTPADAYRCCDLCAIACGSTATLPPVAAIPGIGWLPYETLVPEA